MSTAASHRHRHRRRRRPRAPSSFVTLARRSDVRGAGALSGRDRASATSRRARRAPPPRPSSRRRHGAPRSRPQGAVARYGTDARAGPRAGAPVAVDAARPRGDRRQPPAVLQPGHGHADERRPRRVRRRRLRRLPVADGDRRLRRQGRRRQARRHHGRHQRRAAGSSTPPRPGRGSPSTRPTPLPKAEAGVPRDAARRDASRASSPCTRSARTSAAVCPSASRSQWFECPCHGSQYNRVGEKKAGPAPRGMDRFPLTVAGNGDVTVDTGTRRHRPADRHQHHRPGGRGSALHHGGGEH